jgi:hypothetical protein
VLDDYSRYILARTLGKSTSATGVMETVDLARVAAGVDRVPVGYLYAPVNGHDGSSE